MSGKSDNPDLPSPVVGSVDSSPKGLLPSSPYTIPGRSTNRRAPVAAKWGNVRSANAM